jgi:hypothetical protein
MTERTAATSDASVAASSIARAVSTERLFVGVPGVHVATLSGLAADGVALVEVHGAGDFSPLRALDFAGLRPSDVGRHVVVAFAGCDPANPLVIACMRNEPATTPRPGAEASSEERVVCVSGETIHVSATESLTLKCGRASVTLTREGRVLVNGAYVETRATGTNRIQGGAVRIN